MRDPEVLLSLLRQMAQAEDGRFHLVRTMGADENVHHMELLADAGHVEWHEPKFPRITNDGYDFIEAVDKNPRSMEVFRKKVAEGMPYFNAALTAIKVLTG